MTSADIILLEFNMRRTANNFFRNEVGVVCVKNINFASRPCMYFAEQGNVDDDATFITIFLVHSIDSLAVCSLQMSYTDFEAGLHLPHPFLLCQCVLSSCIDNFAKIGPKLAYLRKSWMIAKKTTRKPFLVFVFYR